MIKKIIFNTAKEAFRRGFRKYKRGQKKEERVPYDLVKSSIKRSIRSTKFMDKTAYQQAPKTTSIPRGGNPRIVGKAYASDRAAKKTMMIPMMTKQQRAANQQAISDSVRKFLKDKMNRKKYGGVMKKKLLLGGLLTAGIKGAYKAYRKSGGRKTSDIVKESNVSRSIAKSDVKSALRNEIKSKIPFKNFHINSPHLIKSKRRIILRDLNKLK